jgi:iron complex outermembrane receptor protein
VRFTRLLLTGACVVGLVEAQRVGSPTDELDKLSVEELFGIQVTSVGRKAQQLSKAPAAVFVLTSEDIRRSGANSIPEALRWVPGMTVLRLDGRSWVVSARGSARLYSDKILVMIDGRSLYNPLFSGVIWDAVDVLMEDVERIEIVRGPGAVMWGPNAVNAVINIITRRAQATKGGLVSIAAGNELRGAAAARVGVAPSDRVAYRFWGKTEYETPAYHSPGEYLFANQFIDRDPSIDNLDFASTRLGFRMDAQTGKHDSWMLQGDMFKNDRQDPSAYAVLLPDRVDRFQGHTDYEGGFVQARWTRSASESKETVLQFSFDRTDIDYPFAYGSLNNATVDWQKRAPIAEQHELYWGAGYQQYWDTIPSRFFGAFNPVSSVYRVGDVVVRDEWQIVPSRLMVSAGIRLDYNSYGHLEYQPSFRLLYTPNPKESIWFGASRAIRSPSRFDRDIQVDDGAVPTPFGIPMQLGFSGSKNMRSETERGLEVGYRKQSGQRWSIDASAYWNYYARLRVLEGPLFPELTFRNGGPVLSLPMTAENQGAGRSYGAEIWGYWQVRPRWRLTPSYSYLNETRWLPVSALAQYAWDGRPALIGHQAFIRSQHDLARSVQVDLMLRARSHDRAWDLPGVLLADARLAWRPTRAGELSIAVENLLDRRVLECYSEGPTPAIPVRRTFVLKWTQRF